MKFNNRSKSKQNTGNEEIEDTLVQEKYIVDLEDMINVLAEEARRNFSIRLKSLHSEINVLAEEARRNFSIRLKSLHSEINVLAEEARMNFINILKSLHSEINVLAEEARRNFRFRLKSIHSENTGHDENEDTVVHEKDNVDQKEKINVLAEEARMNFINRLKSLHSEINVLAQEARRNFINRLKSLHSEGREVTRFRPEQTFSPLSNNWINVLAEEVKRNFINRSKSIHSEDSVAHFKLLVVIITTSEKTGDKAVEDIKLLAYITVSSERKGEKLVGINVLAEEVKRNFINRSKSIHSEINVLAEEVKRNFINRSKSIHSEDIKFFYGSKTSSEKTGKKLAERHKSTEASEGSTNRPIHRVDRHTTYNSQEDKRIGMRDSMINENGCKVQDKQIPSSEANTDASSDESLSTFESTLIRLYGNVIRNETSRMMSSIDMVGFKAEHLFGLERSRIFFDLLDEELCHFGSAGAISEFVPNMAESTVRQHVILFFEHACNIMSRLMTLLSFPDSKILQQMPVQNFISLMKSIIKSSLKAQTKGREKLSLEGNIYIMDDQKDFERALGEEYPGDVLNRLRNEDEMVVHRFVDTRLERHQPSDKEENRPYFINYFPSDCRLFIYIPTPNGSYWHHSDMRRADRIRRHSR